MARKILSILIILIIGCGAAEFFFIARSSARSPKRQNAPTPVADTPTAKTSGVLPQAAASIPAGSLRIPIFLYHYVENVQDPRDTLRQKLAIRPQYLDQQLAAIKDGGYQTLEVKDIPEILNGQESKPSKAVILTFDDGYADFYTDAFPLLKKYQIHATLYIVKDFLDTGNYLTTEQLREIVSSGLIEIGAHTLTHPNLTRLPADQAVNEIQQSKSWLEQAFGVKVTTFAYPYGFYNDQITKDVKDAGFAAAVIIKESNIENANNLLVLPRYRAGVLIVDPTRILKHLAG